MDEEEEVVIVVTRRLADGSETVISKKFRGPECMKKAKKFVDKLEESED